MANSGARSLFLTTPPPQELVFDTIISGQGWATGGGSFNVLSHSHSLPANKWVRPYWLVWCVYRYIYLWAHKPWNITRVCLPYVRQFSVRHVCGWQRSWSVCYGPEWIIRNIIIIIFSGVCISTEGPNNKNVSLGRFIVCYLWSNHSLSHRRHFRHLWWCQGNKIANIHFLILIRPFRLLRPL